MKSTFVNDGTTKNGVLIAAKRGYIATSVTPGKESAGSLMRVQFDSWVMLACYFPQLEAKAAYFDVCRRVAQDSSDQPLLIVGDMNTGNQLIDKTPTGTKYACSDRFDQLSQKEGLVDLWRRSNGMQAREWTWLTKRNGFRLDHAFGNRPFVERFDPRCWYDHRPRGEKHSDHSAVLISLEAAAL
jgi:exonuclease III